MGGWPPRHTDLGRVLEGDPFLIAAQAKPLRKNSSKERVGPQGRVVHVRIPLRDFLMFTSVVNGIFFYQKLGIGDIYLVSNHFAELLTHSNAPSNNFLSLQVESHIGSSL